MRNAVYIQSPHYDKNYSLCIEHENKQICNGFKRYCMLNMPDGLHWFLQSDCDTFKMFECWVNFKRFGGMQDVLLEFGQKVADEFKLPFDIV